MKQGEAESKAKRPLFKGFKISSKIILSFAMIFVLLIVVIAVFTVNIRIIKNETKEVEDVIDPINSNANAMLYFMYNINKAKDTYRDRDYRFQLQSSRDEINVLLSVYKDTYEKMLGLVEEREDLKQDILEANDNFTKFLETLDQLFAEYDNNQEKSLVEIKSETRFIVDIAQTHIIRSIQKMQTITVQTNKMNEDAIKKVNSVVDRLHLFMIIAFSLSGIVFCITGLILYFSVSHPTRDLAEALEDISEGEGDLTVELKVRRQDELGKIETSFNTFISHIREVISGVKDTAVDLAASIVEMTETSSSIAGNVKDQAAAAEEVSATVEEISAGGEQIAKAARDQLDSLSNLTEKLDLLSGLIDDVSLKLNDTVTTSENFSSRARGGETLLQAMEESMKKIFNSSAEIQSIVTIIGDISEQINLLSLNASIEAARAGEHGKGFAVVADEISKLADATAQSLGDIDNLINANNDEITTGLSNVNQTVEMLSEIIEGFSGIRDMMEKLSGVMNEQLAMKNDVSNTAAKVLSMSDAIKMATEEQRISMNEISQSISNINQIAQSNAMGVEQIADTSKRVGGMAEHLKEEVDFFKV